MMKITPVIHIKNKEQACIQAELALNEGSDGVWLINHHGNDVLTLSIAKLLKQRYNNKLIGVNLLSTTAESAIKACEDNDIDYVWLDNAGVHSKHQDKILLKQLKKATEQKLTIFAGTAFKYQLTEPYPEQATQIAMNYGLIPTTSGKGTGQSADIDKIKRMAKVACGNLALASGLTPENIALYHPYINYGLVATGISKNEHELDKDKLRDLIQKNKALNKKQY